jgi:hypothetical protein
MARSTQACPPKPRSAPRHQSMHLAAVERSAWHMDWITTPLLSTHVELTCVSRQHCSLHQSRIVGCRLHNNIEGTLRDHRFEVKCFSALPDPSLVTCIVPVSVAPTTQSLESSKSPRPATVINNSVTVHPTIVATFSDYVETQDEWKRPLLEHHECISGKNQLREILSSGN